jgi:SET domain-containing protein
VKAINYVHASIAVGSTKTMGRGVFAGAVIDKGVLIEVAPVIVMPPPDRIHLDRTLLHDYIFEWGASKKQCCMALGYIPLYNHSYDSNCTYEMDFKKEIIRIRTVRKIKKGEELFINYNGEPDDKTRVWFDSRERL